MIVEALLLVELIAAFEWEEAAQDPWDRAWDELSWGW